MIKLSIIIPIYNGEKYIGECLHSILSQNVPKDNYELILVNDGSKDNSKAILKQFESKYSNLKVIHQENKGQSAARNEGLKHAVGEYIWFIDIDDMVFPCSLEIVLDNLEKGIQLVVFNCFHDQYKPFEQLECPNIKLVQTEILNGNEFIAKYDTRNAVWFYAINRSFLNSLNLHFSEGHICEDTPFTITLLLNAYKIKYIKSKLYFYIIREGSSVSDRSPRNIDKMILGMENASIEINKLIDRYNSQMSAETLNNIRYQADSYTFFLFIWLYRYGNKKRAFETHSKFKEMNILPLEHFPTRYYNTLKYRLLTFIINKPSLYKLLCSFKDKLKKPII